MKAFRGRLKVGDMLPPCYDPSDRSDAVVDTVATSRNPRWCGWAPFAGARSERRGFPPGADERPQGAAHIRSPEGAVRGATRW